MTLWHVPSVVVFTYAEKVLVCDLLHIIIWQASHLRLELESAQSQVSEYQKNMATLNGRLDELHAANSSAEDALQHFHRKLGRIRTSLTKEVDKVSAEC